MKNLKFLHVIYILSKNLRLQCLKDSVNTAHYSVQLRLINTRFVSYNDRALLFSRQPDMMRLILPALSPPLFHTASDQKLEAGTA